MQGEGRIIAPGRVSVTAPDGTLQELTAKNVVVAIGSNSSMPQIAGLAEAGAWTNREATVGA